MAKIIYKTTLPNLLQKPHKDSCSFFVFFCCKKGKTSMLTLKTVQKSEENTIWHHFSLCSPGRYRISNRGTVKSFFACSLFPYFTLCAHDHTHTQAHTQENRCGNFPKWDIRFWFQRWVKKQLDNGISESWKVILSKLSFVEDNECRLSLCVTIQQRISLRAQPQHTIELQLAKNSNQAKTKRCVEFNSLACSFWYEFVSAMLMVEVIHQHTMCVCVSTFSSLLWCTRVKFVVLKGQLQ